MEIKVADQRILLFPPQVSESDAKQKSWDKKTSAFDTFSKVASFITRPKDEDFELMYSESRFEPFWHVVAHATYVYDRSATYQVGVTGTEVQSVTLYNQKHSVTNNHIHTTVTEHCKQELADEVFINGVTGENTPEYAKYLSLSPTVVSGELAKAAPEGSIFVPPQTRVSAIMRDSLSKMIKGIQADTIHEETVEVTCVDLYYRPVYAFQYLWKSKNKQGILEIDGLTGSIASGNRIFREYLGKVLDRNFLFEVGADAAGLLVPGGTIAVKVAKQYIDSKK